MKTFYTKCGRKFEKSSTASVTGYHIDDNDQECTECPFRLEVTKGWPAVHERWECRAGSKPPNKKNEWSGRLDDKTTLSIKSLNIDFIEKARDYLIQNEGKGIAGWSFNQDLDDCRRVITVAVEQNKKGIAAKKSLVEQLFEATEKEEKLCLRCSFCRRAEKFRDHPLPYICFNKDHRGGLDWHFGSDNKACSNYKASETPCLTCKSDKSKCVESCLEGCKEGLPCKLYTSDATEQLTEGVSSQNKYVDEKGRLIFVRSGIGGDTFKAHYQDAGKWGSAGAHGLRSVEWRKTLEEAQLDLDTYAKSKGWKVACHMSGCGAKCRINNDGICSLELANFEDMDAEAERCGFIRVNDRYLMQKYGVTYKEFICKSCEHYDGINCTLDNEKRYREAIACKDFIKKEDQDLNCKIEPCAFNNGGGGCGFESNDVKNLAFAEYAQEAIKLGCRNEKLKEAFHNQPPLTTKKKPRSIVDGVCEEMREDCPCFCNHNDGCSVRLIKGDVLRSFIESTDRSYSIDCDIYRNVKESIAKEAFKTKAAIELVKTEDKYVEEEQSIAETSFDYSSVDEETADFLQEKANRIVEIRIKSVIAIGKELKEAQERLANHNKYEGVFVKWIESTGVKKSTAYDYLRAYDYVVRNSENIIDFENVQTSLLFAISKPSAPQELQEKVLAGDITTHKQYKEMEAKLRAAEDMAKTYRANWEEERESSTDLEEKLDTLQTSINREATVRDMEIRRREAAENKAKELEKENQDLKKQLNEPVEIKAAAVIEKIPDEVERELNTLREKLGDVEDYNYISDILSKIYIANSAMMRNWARVMGEKNALSTLQKTRNDLIGVARYFEGMIDYLDDEIKNKNQ